MKKPEILLKDGPDNEVFDPKKKLQVKQTLKVGKYFQKNTFISLFDLLLYPTLGSTIIPTDIPITFNQISG